MQYWTLACFPTAHLHSSVVISDKKRDYHGLNSMRVAEVWMDGYKRIFYMLRPDLVVRTKVISIYTTFARPL